MRASPSHGVATLRRDEHIHYNSHEVVLRPHCRPISYGTPYYGVLLLCKIDNFQRLLLVH